VSRELAVPPAERLVIEESPSGVQATVAAGSWYVAVTTPLTGQSVGSQGLLDVRRIVDDPSGLMIVVRLTIEEPRED
jgi:beta-phosphoglucomutase-like phosphatase (HAD superfamily)